METFVKRYSWTIGLLLLAVIASLNGRAISNILSTWLIPPPARITINKPRASKAANVRKSQSVEARNVFDSSNKGPAAVDEIDADKLL